MVKVEKESMSDQAFSRLLSKRMRAKGLIDRDTFKQENMAPLYSGFIFTDNHDDVKRQYKQTSEQRQTFFSDLAKIS